MASLHEIQALVQRIHDDLPLLIQRSKVTPQQIVTVEGLSDISKRLGLVQAGEFRAGNGKEPGFGFSGVRLGYPSFVYAGDTYHFAGVNNDVLQVGIKADDGKIYAGGGDVIVDVDGVSFVAGTSSVAEANAIKWFLNADEVFRIIGYITGFNNQLLLQTNEIAGQNGQIVLRAHSETSGSLSSVIRLAVFKDGVESGFISVLSDSSGNDTITLSADNITMEGKTNNAGSPIHSSMLVRAPDSVGQGAWGATYNTSYAFNGLFYNTSNTNGDNFTINFYLPAGTYKVRIKCTKDPNRGIMKVEVGATNLGDTDLYSAVADYTYIAEYTGISITTGGLHAVKFTVNGKNASSGNHFIDPTAIEFIRTA